MTHSNFNDELNPAISDYVKEANDEMNPKVAQRWSERRKKYLQMVAGMNNMWNNGKKGRDTEFVIIIGQVDCLTFRFQKLNPLGRSETLRVHVNWQLEKNKK